MKLRQFYSECSEKEKNDIAQADISENPKRDSWEIIHRRVILMIPLGLH